MTNVSELQLAMEPTYILDVKGNQAKHWIIVGAGGNGGYFIPQLTRAISLQNRELTLNRRPIHQITIIDADKVEDKNLNRQNFLTVDVGENKAKVMAMRYGRAFGLEINVVDQYIENAAHLRDIMSISNLPPVFVGAVDNNKTRAIIYEVFKSRRDSFYLDAGNEEWAGQVVMGYNAGGAKPNPDLKAEPHIFDIPSAPDIFPEMLDGADKLPTELSCAERAVSNPQNIFTNMTAANLMMGFSNQILNGRKENGTGIKQHCIIFNTETLSQKTTLNKMRFLVPEKKEEVKKAEKPAIKVEVTKEVEAPKSEVRTEEVTKSEVEA